MTALRNLATGLFRLNGLHKIKETTEMICCDHNRASPSWLRNATCHNQ
jgi:hypothetical protein